MMKDNPLRETPIPLSPARPPWGAYPRDTLPPFGEAFRQFIAPEFRPKKPILSRSDYIITQGSCFAENIAHALGHSGVKANWIEMRERINSPLANRTYLEYALTDKPITAANHAQILNKDALNRLREEFAAASAFIFTAGLAFVKTDLDGALDFLHLDGQKSKWQLTNVAENKAHIQAIIDLVRSANPSINIILSVSPIPMKGSPIGGSAVAADCRSKSILRTAVGDVMDLGIPHVYYWPSFEAVRWLGCHVGPVYGSEGTDHRHVGPSYLNEIMGAFVEYFFKP